MLSYFSQLTSFCVINLGCKVNRVESDTFTAYLLQLGAQPAPKDCAELVIVNTCTVTGEAEKKTRKAVRSALLANNSSRLIITGCSATINADYYENLGTRVSVIERNELLLTLKEACNLAASSKPAIEFKKSAIKLEAENTPRRKKQKTNLQASNGHIPLRLGSHFHTRVNIKVQDGCNHACSYCIVSSARGPAKSAPMLDVIDEAKRYFEQGVNEIVLTGIDLGSYQSDGAKLYELLARLTDVASKISVYSPVSPEINNLHPRIRLSSIEPMNINDKLIKLIADSNGLICKHLHLPLQSGSSKVLQEMKRPYDAQQFKEICLNLYESMPTLALSTDIICGFPGETDKDFNDTLNLAQDLHFSKVHVFPYSKRKGTPAAERFDQIASDIKVARAAKLRELAKKLRSQDLINRKGMCELVLVQPKYGITESYHEVKLEGDFPPGALIPYAFN